MVKEEKKPYGYIYRVTNIYNGKNYIGKTEKTLEERWKWHLKKARALERARETNPDKKISGTHLNNSINKYGSEAFTLKQEDVAYSLEELNAKERYYVKEYDSMNPDKGYNMREGGEGGSLRPDVIEKLTEISQERAKDPNWLKKMTEINQEIARNPESQEKMSETISNKWQELQYQENVSKGATSKWQETKHRERQFRSRVEGKREIADKGEFLRDIQDMKKKDINVKYDMDGKSINVRIKEMLGHHGVNNYSEAKKYLENKNLDEVEKDINARLNEQTKESKGKKVISNTREFLEDVQEKTLKEIAYKYGMHQNTLTRRIQEMLGDKGIKNYTELRNYLQDKNLDDVVKGIEEKLKDQSHITEGSTIISDKKQFLKDIREMQKNEIDQKYGMDAKTVNNKIKEMLGDYGVKNYTEAKEYLKDKNLEDVLKDIENKSDERQDRSSETTNEEQKEDTKQEEDNNEKQSEERSKELNDKESDESDMKKPEEPSEEITEESTKEGEEEETETQETQSEESKEMEKRKEKERLSDMIGDTSNRDNKGKDKREMWDEYNRLIYTSGKEQDSGVQRSSKDYDAIDKSFDDRGSDYDGIDRHSEGDKSDIKSLDGGDDEEGNDYEGIDKPQESEDKDYDKLDDHYGEGGYE